MNAVQKSIAGTAIAAIISSFFLAPLPYVAATILASAAIGGFAMAIASASSTPNTIFRDPAITPRVSDAQVERWANLR